MLSIVNRVYYYICFDLTDCSCRLMSIFFYYFSAQSVDNIPIMFGNNAKAQLAARTVFGLAHRHSDILHDGWKNILDCMLQLYRAKLLAEVLVTVGTTFVSVDAVRQAIMVSSILSTD
jgi:hypothetical protein